MVLDSCGIGELPDAGIYGDEGSNTLVNTAAAVGGLTLPSLERLGLGKITAIQGLLNDIPAAGNFGKMAELSVGKDSTAGHWEMMGIVLDRPFPVFPKGFPKPLIEQFEDRIGTSVIGNYPASGTEIIEKLGAEHIMTGYPIVYTSGDSVFQIAAHEKVVSLEKLYHMCRIARELLTGPYAVGRVIARPFTGQAGSFKRTADRRDFSISPPGDTILDQIVASGDEVIAIGKIDDLFGSRGITQVRHTESNQDGVKSTIGALKTLRRGLIFTTLVDFDTLWGH
ncbi:MAG: phosphopentomutase, partial [candidate division Zixibacteria bacterium]|nr:phosphopentomutase [candidate division Zixibacteria bacterium]